MQFEIWKYLASKKLLPKYLRCRLHNRVQLVPKFNSHLSCSNFNWFHWISSIFSWPCSTRSQIYIKSETGQRMISKYFVWNNVNSMRQETLFRINAGFEPESLGLANTSTTRLSEQVKSGLETSLTDNLYCWQLDRACGWSLPAQDTSQSQDRQSGAVCKASNQSSNLTEWTGGQCGKVSMGGETFAFHGEFSTLPLILSVSKYSRNICGGRNERLSITAGVQYLTKK